MASPQKENGHIDIANEIADHLAKTRIPGEEMQVLWVIFRKTWGWHKKIDTISHTQFSKATRIKRRHIGNLLKNLLNKNIITKNSDSYIYKYGIQKDWEKWKLSLKKVTITKKGDTPITKNSDATITKNSDHKRKKENYTKENTNIIFDFWKEILNHPKAKLLSERIKKIKDRLKEGYTLEECKQAILGCKGSAYHMGDNHNGKNGKGVIYDSFDMIFRKGNKVEQFIGYYEQSQKDKSKGEVA